MNHSTTLAAVLLTAALLAASGCASNYGAPSTSAGYPMATQAEAAAYGTIETIQVVQSKAGPSGAGAVAGGLVGALLGNQIGSGGGRTAATVAGAVGGAMVGNNVEGSRTPARDQYQIGVRMDNGDYRIVTQDSIVDLRTGNRVRLVDGRVYRY